MYKVFNGIVLFYIFDFLELKLVFRYNFRFFIDIFLLKYFNFKSFSILGDCFFKCVGLKLWNELLKDICNVIIV